MKFLRDLADAFSYFSILPVRHADERPADDAIAFLPLVGLIIGGLSGFCGYGVWLLTHSGLAAAIAAWVLSIALSGAIHVDGFLDCCDGLFAMTSPQRRLEIMRDPHHGTYAIVGMAVIGVLWLYALVQIPPDMLPAALAFIGCLARWSAIAEATRRILPGGVLVAVLVVSFHGHWIAALAGIVVAIGVSGVARAFARSRLDGAHSGDCYGAAIVVTEVALLLAFPYLVFPYVVLSP